MRIGLVMSAGGLRGAAHLGVLKKLVENDIPIDVMVGTSAGAVIAGFYAGLGVSVDEMICDAKSFQGRHLLVHGLRLRLSPRMQERLAPYCGIIPDRLRQLEKATFDDLKFNVKALGIVCHDIATKRPVYFSTGGKYHTPLAPVVRASAAIPYIMPSRKLECEDASFHLTDGGVSDPLPTDFAQSEPLSATHLIISDCRSDVFKKFVPGITGSRKPVDLVHLKHALKGTSSLRSPKTSLLDAVSEGEASVTDEVLERIRSWKTHQTVNEGRIGWGTRIHFFHS